MTTETNTAVLGLLAETSLHPGAGQSSGIVDLPVARESTTDYPVIVGSSLKGAFRQRAREYWPDSQSNGDDSELSPNVKKLFGVSGDPESEYGAGNILFSDARLLGVPVRSMDEATRWVTCPHLLERCKRDLDRSGYSQPDIDIPDPAPTCARGKDNGELYLEERQFEFTGEISSGVQELIRDLLPGREPHEDTRDRIMDRLVILNDEDFQWFARYGLEVRARNSLEDETKTTKPGALWYEESLPPDTFFYVILRERSGGTGGLNDLREVLTDRPYLQVGANETVGQGWLAVHQCFEDGE